MSEQPEAEDVAAGGAAEVGAALEVVAATLEVVTATLVVVGPDGFVQHNSFAFHSPSPQGVDEEAPGDWGVQWLALVFQNHESGQDFEGL